MSRVVALDSFKKTGRIHESTRVGDVSHQILSLLRGFFLILNYQRTTAKGQGFNGLWI